MDPLHLSLQTITELLDPLYWQAVCPWLSCTSLPPGPAAETLGESDLACSAALTASRTASLIHRGFFKIDSADAPLPVGLASSLEAGVHRLTSLGHSPTTIILFDESWELTRLLGAQLTAAQPGNVASGDAVAFLVTPQVHVFTGPHRDKPLAGPSSFKADGLPYYTTCWVALSDASPDASCLYFLPKDRDAGYFQSGDAIAEALPSPSHWPSIVAQPCLRGDVLCFSHRLLHWGSTQAEGAPSRVALSFAYAHPSFEVAAFLPAFLPHPPLGLRLGLLSGQAILYAAQAPLSKGQLALNNRIFASQRAFFSLDYSDKVLCSAQSQKFIAQMSRKAR